MTLPKAGNYVIAVSGGVDSMALLHRLHQEPDLQLTVAHFDHGIREDSAEDRVLVQIRAKQLGMPFVFKEGQLGPGTSEAEARSERYKFLRQVQKASGARAIITAHHQDDLLETAIINMLRGTGRKGLTALRNRHDVARPLLHIPKQAVIAYAKDQGIVWHEDSTNTDEAYLRNYVRRRIVSRFDKTARLRFLQIITDLEQTNQELDTLLVNRLHFQSQGGVLDRQWFNYLPHSMAREVLAAWLRAHNILGFDSKTLERLVVMAKVAQPGQVFPVIQDHILEVKTDYLALTRRER